MRVNKFWDDEKSGGDINYVTQNVTNAKLCLEPSHNISERRLRVCHHDLGQNNHILILPTTYGRRKKDNRHLAARRI